ncbi:MAG: hypothetical protein ACFFDK_02330 [Promethearchaeota archaeon]
MTGNSITSEEVIFCIDLTTEFIEKEILINTIKKFVEEKLNLVDSSFGIVIFQEDDNPISLYDEKDSNSIIKIIDEKWDTRPKSSSYIENALFEILSYIFRKSREIKKVYRVIVISDTPSEKSEEYHNALYDLIIKSKNLDFLTIIDVIRLGERTNYLDEVKLKVITSETQGGTFLCNSFLQFKDVLSSLIKSKREFNIIRPDPRQQQYLKEDKSFYEKLAVDLISLSPDDEEICSICSLEVCPVCGAFSDEIKKCFNCGSKFHGCEIAKYAISNNFGYNHIFRCPQCQTLLKLDEEYVNLVYEEEFGEPPVIKVQEISEIAPLEIRKTVNELELIPQEREDNIHQIKKEQYIEEPIPQEYPVEEIYEKEDEIEEKFEKIEITPSTPSPPSLITKPPPPSPPIMKKVRVGGYFGQEIAVNEDLKSRKKIIKDLPESRILAEKKSITELKPPKKRTTIKMCVICGCTVSNVIVCPNCGAKIT